MIPAILDKERNSPMWPTDIRPPRRLWTLVLTTLAVCAGSGCKSPETGPVLPITPNDFLAAAAPTFVTATLGDDAADARVRGQAELVRELLFPKSTLVTDVEAASTWPEHPVVYGGPHVNALMRDLAPGLPFVMDAAHLAIGDLDLKGDSYQLVTVLPARSESPSHPEMLLYAGTGPVGVAEINAIGRGNDAILVADVFGPLHTGRWVRAADGTVKAKLGPAGRRIAWRDVSRAGAAGTTIYRFPAELAAAADESDLIDAAQRGLEQAVVMLEMKSPPPLTIYVHPDVRSKQALTGNAGDGHAIPGARALHIVARSPVSVLTSLVAHEATHILAYAAYGAAGTPLLGEGLAVWVSGQYGGGSLDNWEQSLGKHPSLRDMLGPIFRKTAERVAYPSAGLLVKTAVELVGREAVTTHLYGATASTWDTACRAAGTTSDLIEQALARRLERP